MCRREGLGDVLADGSAQAAKKIGKNASDYLITVKGQEAPAHMPQSKKALALIYSVNPFGADHQSCEHDPFYEEGGLDVYYQHLSEIGLDKIQQPGSFNEEKARFIFLTECYYSALDSYNLCQFVWSPSWTIFGPKDAAQMLSAATGWDVTTDEVLLIGERRLNMLRAFNAREGFTRKEDVLPKKFYVPQKGEGPTAGVVVDAEMLEHLKDVYYGLAGWDINLGVPTPETLKKLELEWVEF
jgi:aldehyde:ferredoxin oxidoreductase